MAVQWYCAPAMGHIEAISASERAVAITPVIDSSIPHTSDAGPPFVKPGENPLCFRSASIPVQPELASSHLATDSHEASNVMDSASIERDPKLRFNTDCSAVNLVGAKLKGFSLLTFNCCGLPIVFIKWPPTLCSTSDRGRLRVCWNDMESRGEGDLLPILDISIVSRP
jgi:hypothetical protein